MQTDKHASKDHRSLKISCLALLLILLTFSVMAYDECDDNQPSDKIPCVILLPYNSDCSGVSVNVYNGSTLLSSSVMANYTGFTCYSNFTYSALGTYNFNYTTGDSGSIVVQEGNKMIYLLYFGLALIALLMILGFWLQNQPLLLLGGLVMIITSVWVFINGFSIYDNLMTQAIASVFFAVGAYMTVMSGLAMIEGDSD